MFFDSGRICLPSEVSRLPAVTSFSRTIFGSKVMRKGALNRSLAFSTFKVTVIAEPSGPAVGVGVKLTRAGATAAATGGAAAGGGGGGAVRGRGVGGGRGPGGGGG